MKRAKRQRMAKVMHRFGNTPLRCLHMSQVAKRRRAGKAHIVNGDIIFTTVTAETFASYARRVNLVP